MSSLMRNEKGQFSKGHTYRKPKPFWNKEWLLTEYIHNKKSTRQIAKEQGCNHNNILYFLKKFKIKARSMKEIRKEKYWGLCGELNGMFGKRGECSPNWRGGIAPPRQKAYATIAWKALEKTILKRDNRTCVKCKTQLTERVKINIHHIEDFDRRPDLRFEPTNLMTLCKPCHQEIHSGKK